MGRLSFVKWIAVLALLGALIAPVMSPVLTGPGSPGGVALAQDGGEEPAAETPPDTENEPTQPTENQQPIDSEIETEAPPIEEPPIEESVQQSPTEIDSFGIFTITVLDAQTGVPIADATVTARDIWTEETAATGATNGEGVFFVEQIPDGDYSVIVSRTGYLDENEPSVQVEGDTDLTVSMTSDQPVDTPTVERSDAPESSPVVESVPDVPDSSPVAEVVDASQVVPAALGSLTVTVRDDATDAVLAGAIVEVRDSEYGLVAQGVTDSGGLFTVASLADGQYVLMVHATGYFDVFDQPLQISGVTSQDIRLVPIVDGTLTVTVLDDRTDTPVVGARIEVGMFGKGSTVLADGITDENGVFVSAPIQGGQWTLLVDRPGYFTAWIYNVAIDGDTSQTVRLIPQATGSLTITVLDNLTNAPIENATVEIRDLESYETAGTGLTDSNGKLVISDLPSSYYSVEISHPDYFANDGWEDFELGGDTSRTIHLEPKTAGTVAVSVVDDITDLPIADATVDFYGGNDYSDSIATAVTGNDGIAISSSMPGGDYEIVVSHPDYFGELDYVRVDGDIATAIRLRSDLPGVLTVTVIDDQTNEPVDEAMVTVSRSNSVYSTGTTGNDGVFTTSSLSASIYSYNVTISHPDYFDGWGYVSIGGDTSVTIRLERSLPGTLSVTVLDAQTESPIGSAEVEILDWNTYEAIATGITNDDGVVVTAELPAGRYVVIARHLGYWIGDSYIISVNGDTTSIVRLKPAIAGVVTITALDDKTGAPIDGATVEIRTWYDDDIVTTGSTNELGIFTTDQLPGNDYAAFVSHPDYIAYVSPFTVEGDIHRIVRLTPNVAGTLTVTVLDWQTHAPIAGASVDVYEAYGTDPVSTATTDGNGNVTTAQLAGGYYTVKAAHPNYFTNQPYVWIRGDSSATVYLAPKVPALPTNTPVASETAIPTQPATVTPTQISTSTPVNTETLSPTPSRTPTQTATATRTPTASKTPSTTATPTPPTNTPVATRTPTSPQGGFAPGSWVKPTTRLNLRSGAGTSTSVITVLTTDAICQVTGVPVKVGNEQWYPVSCAGFGSGYAAGSYLTATTPPAPTATPTQSPVPPTVTATATASNTPTQTPVPPTASATRTPTLVPGGCAPGDWTQPTARLNLRSGPGTGFSVIIVLPTDASCQVTGAPVRVGSQYWYPLDCEPMGAGYVSGSYLTGTNPPGPSATPTVTNTPKPPTNTPTPIPGGFAPGDWVRPTARLNLRNGAGTGNAVMAVLSTSTSCQITSAPVVLGSQLWYPVACAGAGSGFVAGAYLTAAGAPAATATPSPTNTPKAGEFIPGTIVKTTARLNLRSGPNTSASVVTVLPSNTACQVTGGSSVANGHTWYPVSCAGYGTGFVAGTYLKR